MWLEEQVLKNNAYAKDYSVANPLYNALLNSKSESSNVAIDERLQMHWSFYKGMQLQGMLQLTTANASTISYTPPQHTKYFTETDDNKKGNYSESIQKNFSYVANLLYTWSNQIGKHTYTLNARGEIAHDNKRRTNFAAEGFPTGTNGQPSFANAYVDGRPGYGNTVYRRANFLASGNYAYDGRYLFDATIRYDGSTVFGSDKKFTPFWALGVGWNIHNEGFVKNNAHWLTNLRLRATIGQTGNQNLGSVVSSSVYTYLPGSNVFGTGVSLTNLGNSFIEWQKTTTTNLALDINLFDSRFVGKFEVYQKHTNPLVVSIDQAPSTGVLKYPTSLGDLTYRGFEFEGTYMAIRNTGHGFSWRVKLMGSVVRGEYSGFSDLLKNMNENNQNSEDISAALTRYMDGYSPNTIWAVRSLGIDPATGRELFLTKDNETTFVHDPRDVMAVGLKDPDVSGTILSYFTWKQLTLSVALRYSLGQDIFNTALYNKVENIGFSKISYNQDRRALTERWKTPGDIAEFRAITETGTTPMSSRFVQTENYISGESIGLMWRLDKSTWIRHLALERLDFNATITGTGGVFRLSNVKRERGTSYPEAYTIALSVSAVF